MVRSGGVQRRSERKAVVAKLDQVIVVDVEATCWESGPPPGQESEIIEIGVCVLDLQTGQRVTQASILVRPERSEVSPFCTQLTSLTPRQVARGVSFAYACRLLRAQLLSLRERDFVLAARMLGATSTRIAVRHLLPNAVAPLIVAATIGIPTAIFAEAGLSFLGLGINDPIPSWGKMVGNALSYMRVYWHLGVFPTLAIAITMLGFTFFGDGLRDAFDASMNR